MIVGVVSVSLGTGIFVGWVLAMFMASTAMSYSQERMQRKVRYWQAEAAQARTRARAERQARLALSASDFPSDADEWKQVG
jgi:MFS superfamily sulfate permease-like transporter